jgi:DnaJ-class molecular chaperone
VTQALLGFSKTFTNLDGEQLMVQNSSEVTQQGQQIRVQRKGFLDPRRGIRGDLVVIVSIEMPRHLSAQQLDGRLA